MRTRLHKVRNVALRFAKVVRIPVGLRLLCERTQDIEEVNGVRVKHLNIHV